MLALSVPAEVYGVFLYVNVHEVVHDLTLNIVLNTVHQETLTHVYHLDEGQISNKHKTNPEERERINQFYMKQKAFCCTFMASKNLNQCFLFQWPQSV